MVKREDIGIFLDDLPHAYFDENQLYAFIVSELRDYEACLREVERFIPYVDNWVTCDQMSPKVFKRYRAELLDPIRRWAFSDATYTVRFGVGMLMEHYLDDFDPTCMDMVAAVESEEYYVRMMAREAHNMHTSADWLTCKSLHAMLPAKVCRRGSNGSVAGEDSSTSWLVRSKQTRRAWPHETSGRTACGSVGTASCGA